MHLFYFMAAAIFAVLTLPHAALGQRVVIRGSNTFGEELGPRLIAVYREQHPEVTFDLESKGSGTGFAGLLAGTCDIASASRMASEDELRLARSRGIKMKHFTVGYYGVAVIVNEANPVQNLSDRQVHVLFTGQAQNWRTLGWQDRAVRLYIRDPESGTFLGFQELAMDREPYAEGATMLPGYIPIAEAVASDENGVGYVGMHVASHEGVRAVRINGMPASELAVNEGLYPYARLLRFYTDAARESDAARGFIRFVQSKKGQAVLSELGYLPRLRHLRGRPPPTFF